MPRGDHLIVSDELEQWIADTGDDARVGAMLRALVSCWRGAPETEVPDDIAEAYSIFQGQLDRFRTSVAAKGGMDAEQRREYNRRKQANKRARDRGEALPYPDPKAGLVTVSPCVTDVTTVTEVTAVTKGDSGDIGDIGDSGDTGVTVFKNQTKPNQTSAQARARAHVGAAQEPPEPSNGEIVAAFNALWEAYPERKRQARPKAMDAFRAKMLSGSVPSTEDLLASIALWKASFDWRKAGGMYIPAIANFIEQERWNDKPSGEYSPDTIPLREAAPQSVPPMDEATRALFANS